MFRWLVAVFGMIAVGWLVWRTVQAQDARARDRDGDGDERAP